MRNISLSIVLSVVFAVPTAVFAEDFTLPYPEFRPATPAFASSINANFGALADGVNGNMEKISSNAENIAVNSDNIGSNTGSISIIRSDLDAHGHEPSDIMPQGAGSGLNADMLDGSDSGDFAGSIHGHASADLSPQGAGSGLDADMLDGSDSADFALSLHSHLPADIAEQGSGSELDADLLDGADSTSFASSIHLHDGSYSQLGHTHDAEEISGSINADTLDSRDSGDFAASVHSHADYADHNHNAEYAGLKHIHEAMAGDITELGSRVTELENYGDLSTVLDEMAAMKNTIDDLKAKIAELEKRIEDNQ